MAKVSISKKIVALVAMIALVAILGVFLAGCTGKMDDYAKRLEKAGYEVETKDDFDAEDKIEWAVAAQKGEDAVFIYKYVSAEDAKEAISALTGYRMTSRNGSLIMFGTKQGVEDAKGTFD